MILLFRTLREILVQGKQIRLGKNTFIEYINLKTNFQCNVNIHCMNQVHIIFFLHNMRIIWGHAEPVTSRTGALVAAGQI